MKNTNWTERIGFLLILIGFIFMLLNDSWENNPIPKIMGKNMMFSSGGLLIWALGHMKRQADEKKEGEKDQTKMD
jgi:uncharacterized membrane protein